MIGTIKEPNLTETQLLELKMANAHIRVGLLLRQKVWNEEARKNDNGAAALLVHNIGAKLSELDNADQDIQARLDKFPKLRPRTRGKRR